MRSLLLPLTLTLGACASNTPPPSPDAHMKGSFLLRNESASTLTVQPYQAGESGGARLPLGEAFTVPPGRIVSKQLGVPGKLVVVTIRASGQDRKYLSGEWVVTERADGFRLYAFTDHADTVRLSWNDRDGEVVLMQ